MPSPNSRDEYAYKYGEWDFPILLFAFETPANTPCGSGGNTLLAYEAGLS